jgi:hypothetical protein
MRLSSAIRAALVALTVTCTGLATAAYAANGSIRFNVIKAGFVIGGSAGSGMLVFHGRRYPLSIGGVSYGFPFSAAQRPILSVPSATSEGRPMLMAYMARPARASRSAPAQARSCWPTRTARC